MEEKNNEKKEKAYNSDEDEIIELILLQNEEELKLMLSEKEYPIWDYKSKENDNSSVLNLSVYKNDFNITNILINYCKKYNEEHLIEFINCKNDQGIAPIHYAAFKGDIKIIELLIENGADIRNLTNRGLNIIHYSAQGNKPNVLIYFYIQLKEKKNENVENSKDKFKLLKEVDNVGSTPLHWAAFSASLEFMLYYINLDIFNSEMDKINFINQRNREGYTPLHLSISSKSEKIVTKLLQYGANPLLVNNKGETALQIALNKKEFEISKIMKKRQNCQCCNFKAPLRQVKKSTKNILCIFLIQLFVTFIVFFSTIPLLLNEYENTIVIKFLLFSYVSLLLLFFFLYFILLVINPGVKPQRDFNYLKSLIKINENLNNYCYRCYIRKAKGLKHCIVCDKCYENFDHHCYWINKCIAKSNYVVFIVFLVETEIYLNVLLLLNILGLLSNIHLWRHNKNFNVHGSRVKLVPSTDKSISPKKKRYKNPEIIIEK